MRKTCQNYEALFGISSRPPAQGSPPFLSASSQLGRSSPKSQSEETFDSTESDTSTHDEAENNAGVLNSEHNLRNCESSTGDLPGLRSVSDAEDANVGSFDVAEHGISTRSMLRKAEPSMVTTGLAVSSASLSLHVSAHGEEKDAAAPCTSSLPPEQDEAMLVEERVRRAQAAETAVLQRLCACVAALSAPATRSTSCRRGPVSDEAVALSPTASAIDGGMLGKGAGTQRKRDGAISQCLPESARADSHGSSSGGHSSHVVQLESTVEVWLPSWSTGCGDAQAEFSECGARQIQLPLRGLTPDARDAYATLKRLLFQRLAHSEPIEWASKLSGATSPITADEKPLSASPACPHTAASVANEKECFVYTESAAKTYLSFPTVESSEACGEDTDSSDGVYFPTPPYKVRQKEAETEGTARATQTAMERVESSTSTDGTLSVSSAHYNDGALRRKQNSALVASRLPSSGTLEDVVTTSALYHDHCSPGDALQTKSSMLSLCDETGTSTVTDDEAPVAGKTEGSQLASSAPPVAQKAELTATDILATITALPPPPPPFAKSFRGRRRKAESKKHNANCSDTVMLAKEAHQRGSRGKRIREDTEENGESSLEGPRAVPLAGLPCLGVDVASAAAAAAAARLRSPPHFAATTRTDGVAGGRHGLRGTGESSSSAVQREESPPPRGYVRSRPQRAEDVARTEAVFAAVRRAAVGGAMGSSPDRSRSPSQSSYDSVQHTPAQYWDIDFS